MSHFRKYYSPSTLNSSNASSTSASSPSTVIHVGPSTATESSSDNVQVSTDPNPLPSTHLSSTASAFRGQSTNRGALPTSNFLINRHKLLRKTEEGKVMREGGTLSGSRSQLTGSSSNLAQKPKEYENYGANGKSFVEDEDRHASTDTSRYDDSGGNITETDFSERSEVSRIPVGNVEYSGNERPIEHVTSHNYETDSVAPRAVSSVRWSPSSSSRPQVPPKPDISSNELERKMEEIAAKSKQSRGILRVPSLRGTLTRSRTPSRGPSEERPAKKKEEYLHESVTYTKTKAPAEVAVSSAAPSSGRANFFRGRSGNTVISSSSSRAEVSSPQLLNTTTDQVGSAVEIGGTSRRISPSPQRTSIIPAPVQTGTVQITTTSLRETDRPVDVETIVQNAPVYSRLSDVRSAPKQTTRIQQMMESSRFAVPSPTPSGFIQPQIRPTPPRKPIRTDVNETLIEVLPQGKARRPAPAAPAVNLRAATAGRSEQHVTTIRTSSPSPTRAGHLSTVANLSRHSSPTPGVTVSVNNHNNAGHDAARPIQRIESAPKSINDSYAGQMTFDDEFDSLMSSSHVDYEHSSADEDDDLVKRSLMKASGNRRGNIENIEEENITTTYVDNAPTVYRTEVATHSQSHYDKLPQRPNRTVVQRKPSFLSSADDSDSSRGQGNLAGPNVRSSVTTTRLSRRESDVNQADAQLPRDDSAGRRKYDERRQLLRSFEENLQRKRHQSAKDDDRVTQSNQNGPPRNTQQAHHIYRQTGQVVSQSTSRYAERDSDDDFTDSVGIPEPLPEYEYPSRVQGRTIQEVQEIRESVRLREPSTTSSEDHSPSRKTQKRGHNFGRHLDITPEEYTSTRALIQHRLPPPNYVPDSPPPPPPVLGQTGSRLSLAERNRTPPPTRPIHLSRPHSQSPDNRLRPGQAQARLPPSSPVAPFVHHSDGEGRYYSDQKPKKKMNIVRRLSELVRGERKHKKPEMGRKSSTSSMEQEQENRPPVRLIAARQQSPVRRYQDQPLRQTAPPPQVVSRIPSFNRPGTSNRNSGNFSDSQTASFTYQDQPIPVYAQPNKLLKQQNLRHRSMSEYDLSYNPGHSPGRNIQYVDKPLKNAKSTESVSESVWKEKVRYRYDHDPPDEKYEKVTKTTLIPWTKSKVLNRSGDEGRNTAHVRHGFFDKDLQHYRSTPALPINSNQVDMRMMPAPVKPPRRYDYDANRGSDSDRSEPLRVPVRSSERLREHRMTPNPAPDYYSQPSETSRRTIQTSTSSGGEDSTPQPTRVPLRRVETTISTHSNRTPRPLERTALVRGPVEKIQIQVQPAYARTRMAANDYANRRYQTDLNRTPPDEVNRRSAVREQSGVRGPSGYKAAYKMLIDNPAASGGGGMVQERRRIFNNAPQPARADYYAHRR